MFDVEGKNSLSDYAEVLRKIRCIKSKSVEVDKDIYSQDIERFVADYLKGRLLFEISSSEVNKNIDYDMDFVLKNLGKDWKNEVLYLQSKLKFFAKKTGGNFSLLTFVKKLLLITLILLPVIFFAILRIAVKYDTSFDIMTNNGLENAAKIHFKSSWYDYWRRKYDNVSPVVIQSVLWPIKLTDEEEKYYGKYIALNIEVADMLRKSGDVCCTFCNFEDIYNEDFDEKKADTFIKFLNIPSQKIVEEAKRQSSNLPEKTYYNIVVQSYKEKFPCMLLIKN